MEFIPRGPIDVMTNVRTADGLRLGVGRPAGFHVSEAVREMRRAAKLPEDIEGEQPGVRMQLGFLWEYALELVSNGVDLEAAMELAFKRWMVQTRCHVVKQVKADLDGVHGTPDGFDAQEGVVESYKLTWKSKRKAGSEDEFKEHFWPWLVAEKAYCWALGCDTVRFFICWVNGDYSRKKLPGCGPGVEMYDCVFTEEELASNWGIILQYKKAMRGKGR